MTTGAVRRAKPQSNSHYTANKPTQGFLSAGQMPFLSPNEQCQSIEEKKVSHFMDLLTPSSPGGLPTLSLTTGGADLGRRTFPILRQTASWMGNHLVVKPSAISQPT